MATAEGGCAALAPHRQLEHRGAQDTKAQGRFPPGQRRAQMEHAIARRRSETARPGRWERRWWAEVRLHRKQEDREGGCPKPYEAAPESCNNRASGRGPTWSRLRDHRAAGSGRSPVRGIKGRSRTGLRPDRPCRGRQEASAQQNLKTRPAATSPRRKKPAHRPHAINPCVVNRPTRGAHANPTT